MDRENDEVVVPVVSEELHADAIPVHTGGVRVTKHVTGLKKDAAEKIS
jgi:stress response protein YsnF